MTTREVITHPNGNTTIVLKRVTKKYVMYAIYQQDHRKTILLIPKKGLLEYEKTTRPTNGEELRHIAPYTYALYYGENVGGIDPMSDLIYNPIYKYTYRKGEYKGVIKMEIGYIRFVTRLQNNGLYQS